MVGQRAVVHHLQQDVEHVRMRLLDLVEQQHAMRVLVHAVGQKAALIEPDIARRRADQSRNRVFLHVFRHVEAQQLHPERVGKLLGHLGLADAGGSREEVVADRLLRLPQAGTRQLDGGRKRLDRVVLAEDHALERGFEVLEHLRVVLGHVLGRNAGDLGDDGLDLLGADRLAPLAFGDGRCCVPRRLVNDVDGLSGKLAGSGCGSAGARKLQPGGRS